MSFADLGLSPEALNAVGDAGYTEPTPIQKKAIPIVLQGRDMVGCAQTGTGKTASFTLPMIDILSSGRARARMPRSLVLTPTRELATQIAENFETYGKYHKLSMALLIGGVSMTDQQRKLDRGVDVLIATPGRLIDLFERGAILLQGVKLLVIDEADRMLDMGFIPDVERIIKVLPTIRQTLMFSATMPKEVRRIANTFMSSPKEIHVDPPAAPAEKVVQHICHVSPRNKGKILRDLLAREDVENALIFCNRKKDVDLLNRSLSRHGFLSAALHGDMAQAIRTETLENFKSNKIKFLVATDVAGRGIDIKGLSHVFNYDVPLQPEDYVHRIGRTGRAGRMGQSFTLATPDDDKLVKSIERIIGASIPEFGSRSIATTTPSQQTTQDSTAEKVAKTAKEPEEKAMTSAGRRPRTRRDPSRAEPKTASKSANRRAATPKSTPSASGEGANWGGHIPAFLLAQHSSGD